MSPRLGIQELDVAEPGFDALFEFEPLLLHSVDANGTLLNVSVAWARLLGYDREALIGRRTVDIMTARSRAYALTRGLPELFKHGHVSNISYEFVRADGRPLPVLLSSGAIRDHSGQYVKSLTVITDDRRARYAERELGERRRREADGAAPMNRMLERLAHDTRTPLNAILGFAGLMELGELSEIQAERLAEILKAARTLREQFDALTTEAETPALPVRRESAPMQRQGSLSDAGDTQDVLPLAPMKVLLAEADARQQDAMRERLRAAGHHVVTAANGYEAIEALFAGPVDLAFIDLDMPGLSGPATVSQIRNSGRSFRDIPILACIDEASSAEVTTLRSQGMDGVVPKGAPRGMLEIAMRRALEARSPGG